MDIKSLFCLFPDRLKHGQCTNQKPERITPEKTAVL